MDGEFDQSARFSEVGGFSGAYVNIEGLSHS
jgi:hypothetical protein